MSDSSTNPKAKLESIINRRMSVQNVNYKKIIKSEEINTKNEDKTQKG